MIKIMMTNGAVIVWLQEQYTNYQIDGTLFTVLNEGKLVAIYNLSHIIGVEVEVEK